MVLIGALLREACKVDWISLLHPYYLSFSGYLQRHPNIDCHLLQKKPTLKRHSGISQHSREMWIKLLLIIIELLFLELPKMSDVFLDEVWSLLNFWW